MSDQYVTVTLEQPWGDSEETVRIFPPCEVKESMNEGDDVVVFARLRRSGPFKRKVIRWMGFFPRDGFVAWDDTNEEYAWHNVGSIDVPKARDPGLSKDSTDNGARIPIIRGESETIGGRPDPRDPGHVSAPGPKRKRRGFMDWWTSKSRANDIPDFLRKDTT